MKNTPKTQKNVKSGLAIAGALAFAFIAISTPITAYSTASAQGYENPIVGNVPNGFKTIDDNELCTRNTYITYYGFPTFENPDEQTYVNSGAYRFDIPTFMPNIIENGENREDVYTTCSYPYSGITLKTLNRGFMPDDSYIGNYVITGYTRQFGSYNRLQTTDYKCYSYGFSDTILTQREWVENSYLPVMHLGTTSSTSQLSTEWSAEITYTLRNRLEEDKVETFYMNVNLNEPTYVVSNQVIGTAMQNDNPISPAETPQYYDNGTIYVEDFRVDVYLPVSDKPTSLYVTTYYNRPDGIGNGFSFLAPGDYDSRAPYWYTEIIYDAGNPLKMIWNTVTAFLDTELFPGFKFSYVLYLTLGIIMFGVFLKVFVGG